MAAVQERVSAGRVLVIEAIETQGVTEATTWGIGRQRRFPSRRGER